MELFFVFIYLFTTLLAIKHTEFSINKGLKTHMEWNDDKEVENKGGKIEQGFARDFQERGV